MVRDQFRHEKNSKWKTHIGAMVQFFVLFVYFYRLKIFYLENLFQEEDHRINSGETAIAKFTFYGNYSLNLINPTLFGNNFSCPVLCACGIIFMARTLMCIYVLLPRSISWDEIITVYVLFLGTIFWSFTNNIELHKNSEPSGQEKLIVIFGFCIFIGGMVLSVGSEWQRKCLKVPGRLVTEGLWSLSMHINYFGEFLYYLGWSMITLEWYNLWVPGVILIGFVWWHIPGLDEYLAERYPKQFPEYAKKTKKLIPFVY